LCPQVTCSFIWEDRSLNCSLHVPNFFHTDSYIGSALTTVLWEVGWGDKYKNPKSGGFLLGCKVKEIFTLWLLKKFKQEFSTKLSKTIWTTELTKTQPAKLVWTICCLQLSVCPGQRQMGQKNKCVPASCVHLTVQFISLGEWKWPCSYMSPCKWQWLRSRDTSCSASPEKLWQLPTQRQGRPLTKKFLAYPQQPFILSVCIWTEFLKAYFEFRHLYRIYTCMLNLSWAKSFSGCHLPATSPGTYVRCYFKHKLALLHSNFWLIRQYIL